MFQKEFDHTLTVFNISKLSGHSIIHAEPSQTIKMTIMAVEGYTKDFRRFFLTVANCDQQSAQCDWSFTKWYGINFLFDKS